MGCGASSPEQRWAPLLPNDSSLAKGPGARGVGLAAGASHPALGSPSLPPVLAEPSETEQELAASFALSYPSLKPQKVR